MRRIRLMSEKGFLRCVNSSRPLFFFSPARPQIILEQAEQALYPLRYPMAYLLVWEDTNFVETNECAAVCRNAIKYVHLIVRYVCVRCWLLGVVHQSAMLTRPGL